MFVSTFINIVSSFCYFCQIVLSYPHILSMLLYISPVNVSNVAFLKTYYNFFFSTPLASIYLPLANFNTWF